MTTTLDADLLGAGMRSAAWTLRMAARGEFLYFLQRTVAGLLGDAPA